MENNNYIKSLTQINKNEINSIFSLKMKTNIFYNILLPFFTIEDYKELIKINKYFYNIIIFKNITWIKYLNELKLKYNLEIPLNKIDFCQEIAIKNKRYYKCNFDKSHFIRFLSKGIEHISTFDKENWAWKNDTQYWIEKENNDSLFGEKIIRLITVCFVDTNLTMTRIPHGNYKLYIRHNVFNFEGGLRLIIKLNNEEIYKKNYPEKYMKDDCNSSDIKDKNKDKNQNQNKDSEKVDSYNSDDSENKKGKLANSFLTDIILNEENKNDNTIFIKFEHLDLNWKNDWDLDAIILTPI